MRIKFPTSIVAALMLLVAMFAHAQPTTAPSTNPAGPERFEKEVATLEASFAEQKPAAGGILFYGSSTIRLWDVKKSFPELTALNHGFGGSTMEDAAYFAKRLVLPAKPSVIVLYEGDNDISGGRTPEQVFADFAVLYDSISNQLPETKWFILSIKPSPSRVKHWQSFEQLNRGFAKFAHEHPQVKFVDTYEKFLGPDRAPRPELFRADKLHMNDDGYAIFAEALKPLLQGQTVQTGK